MGNCFNKKREFLKRVFKFVEKISNKDFMNAVDLSKRIVLRIKDENVSLYGLLKGRLGGWPVTREMIDTLAARIFDNPIYMKSSVGYLYLFLYEFEKLEYICNNLSDNLSRIIFENFVYLSILTAFTSMNYLFSPHVRMKLLEEFNLIGLRNTVVWDIYYRIIRDRSFKISEKVIEIETPQKQRLRFYATEPGWIIQDFYLNQYYHSKVKPNRGDVVLDLGAFNGTTALRFAVGGASKIFSFEFDPRYIKFIMVHAKMNGFQDIIEVVPKAVSNRDGHLNAVFNKNGGASYLIEDNEEEQGKLVEVVSIDSWYQNSNVRRIDFIKMDIEGGEINAIRGMENVLKKFHPKLAISVYHKYTDLYDALNLLKRLGYTNFYLSHRTPGISDLILFAV